MRFRSLPSLVLLRSAPSTETLLRQAITQRRVPSEADNARGSIHLALNKGNGDCSLHAAGRSHREPLRESQMTVPETPSPEPAGRGGPLAACASLHVVSVIPLRVCLGLSSVRPMSVTGPRWFCSPDSGSALPSAPTVSQSKHTTLLYAH